MMGFCGYNLCGDMNALDPYVTNLDSMTNTELRNAIYDHINITEDVNTPYNKQIPSWNYETILDCDFNNNIHGGNMDITLAQISSVKIKRRKHGTFDWVALKEVPINDYEDLQFTTFDAFCASRTEYDWAIIPCLNDVEGNYVIRTLTTEFNGVFICDKDNIYKLFNGVSYSSNSSVQMIGILQPIGKRCPTIVRNGKTDYQTLSVSGTILNKDFEKTRQINRIEVVRQKEFLDNMLKNGFVKIVKDWNGNIFLGAITSNIEYAYNQSLGMGILDLSFTLTEQGKYDSQKDMYENGLTDVVN